MNRSTLLAALAVGLGGAVVAPRIGLTASFSPILVFSVCSLGALAGLWIVSYALERDEREAQR